MNGPRFSEELARLDRGHPLLGVAWLALSNNHLQFDNIQKLYCAFARGM
jgi:hypothetical protein